MRNLSRQSKINMPSIKTIAVGVFVGFCLFLFLATLDRASDRVEATPAWNDTMCLRGIIPADGGTITETAGGVYSYTLIARSDGTVEVWYECHASGGTQ